MSELEDGSEVKSSIKSWKASFALSTGDEHQLFMDETCLSSVGVTRRSTGAAPPLLRRVSGNSSSFPRHFLAAFSDSPLEFHPALPIIIFGAFPALPRCFTALLRCFPESSVTSSSLCRRSLNDSRHFSGIPSALPRYFPGELPIHPSGLSRHFPVTSQTIA